VRADRVDGEIHSRSFRWLLFACVYELVSLGSSVGLFCGNDGCVSEGRRNQREFESGYGDPDDGGFGIHVGIGAGDRATVCIGKDLAGSVVLPGVVGSGDGTFLGVLLQSAASWGSVASRAGR